jgi:putative spermidine/putrescine transport system ATP-binding protein
MSVAVEGLRYAWPGSGAGLHGLDLGIAPGELVAVIGPSGCGKSTLLKLIAGFLSPDAGRVLLEGRDATALPPRRRELGVVFQAYALFPHMTALENVAWPLSLRGMTRAERRRRAGEMLERVGLSAQADRRPGALSGGQQQRVALARALVFGPKALLLDEPLSALDAALRISMRDEIRRLQQESGIATLHITHDQEEALSIADRVAVMREGRILQCASPRELYARPASRSVAGFVGHANLWEARVVDAGTLHTPLGALRAEARGFAPGSTVAALVRPERVRPGAAPDGANQFAGRVARDRFLGSFRRVDLALPGGMVVLETGADALPEATSLTFHIPPDAVQVLPADSSEKERTP